MPSAVTTPSVNLNLVLDQVAKDKGIERSVLVRTLEEAILRRPRRPSAWSATSRPSTTRRRASSSSSRPSPSSTSSPTRCRR